MSQCRKQVGGVAILLFLLACGQKQDDGVWVPMQYQLDENRIYQDVAYLASDPLEGREIGTPGNELALDHLEKIFSDLALAPASPSREGCREKLFRCCMSPIRATPAFSARVFRR